MRRLLPLGLLLLCGCVERLISVRSTPPGAAVSIDGEPAGVTPVDIPYTWYGTRDITLEKPGYRSITKRVKLDPPIWQIFPIDLVTDLLIPFTLTDRTEIRVLMMRESGETLDVDALKRSAGEMRDKVK
jgi:hypothetical protein